MSFRPGRLLAALAVIATTVILPPSASASGSLTVTTCGTAVFEHAAAFGINTMIFCPPGTNIPPGMSILTGPNQVPAGRRATWEADAPPGLSVVGVSIGPNQMYSQHLNDGQGWGGGFYWAGGGTETFDTTTQYSVSGLNSSYFGFQIVCGLSTCNGSTNPAQLTVESINLYANQASRGRPAEVGQPRSASRG